MASERDPDSAPPPDAMSWERRISRPPVLNDTTPALPPWIRPFAKPEVELLAATRPKFVVVAWVAAPYAFLVSLVVNALLGVPTRHMLFTVPATTLIGVLLMMVIFAAAELLGWLSGYRPAVVSWTPGDEHAAEVLASALQEAAATRGFIVVWSKDQTFVATRNVEQAARGQTDGSAEHGPRRLSLLSKPKAATTRTLKLGVHGLCVWNTGETEQLEGLARGIVQDAARREPWIAESASWHVRRS